MHQAILPTPDATLRAALRVMARGKPTLQAMTGQLLNEEQTKRLSLATGEERQAIIAQIAACIRTASRERDRKRSTVRDWYARTA